jgi:hypothetical protein
MVMEKTKLEKFISKYNLGGSCESVLIKSDGNTLSVRAISGDKNVLGAVSLDNANFPQGEFGVYDTKKFRSILGVLNETLTVTPNMSNSKVIGLNITDGSTKATVVLSDASVIPAVPDLKKIPPVDFTISLDEKFMNTFIKAKSALSEAETFTVMSTGEDATASVVLGHSSLNTNRITVMVTTDIVAKMEPISFSANYLREILTANKDISNGTLEVSSKGISVAKFVGNGFSSTYYLVQTSVQS